MILVQLRGGLGNQMFQYAFGKYLAVKNQTTLVLDTSFLQSKLPFRRWATQMHYELGVFEVQASIHSNFFNSNAVLYPLAKTEFWLRQWMYKMHLRLVQETEFSFNEFALGAPDNTYLIGNFQSEKYFKPVEQELRADFTFKKPLEGKNKEWQTLILGSNAVSVHIRRGDYISIAHNVRKFALVPLEYYQQAISSIAERIKDPVFFFFSDDPSWVRDHIKARYESYYIDNNLSAETAFLDMHLMSLCKHHIIANSTFSWWGAWLNSHPEKIVIAPQQWFADPSINSKDIYPSEWIKL